MLPNFHNSLYRRAFSLVEVLMITALLSIGSAVILSGVSVGAAPREAKLRRDVAAINRALQVFELNGGDLTNADAQGALDRLKRKASAAGAKQMAGLTGQMIDNRLAVSLLPVHEASPGVLRANWNPAFRRFELQTSGDGGIREFVLNESLGAVNYGEDARRSAMKLASRDHWIWDYDPETPESTAPAQPGTGHADVLDAGDPGELIPLAPPQFSLASGAYELKEFPLTVLITHPNPVTSCEVEFNLNGGASAGKYTTPLVLEGDASAMAFCRSLNPDRYLDSEPADRSYTVIAAVPEVILAFSKSAYDYVDLGGPLEPGGYPPGPDGVTGNILLGNPAAIPVFYQNSTVFVPEWTQDGSDPLTTGAAVAGSAFTGGFNGQPIRLSLADWTTADEVTIKAAIKSLRPGLVMNSSVKTAVLGISVRTLRAPRQIEIEREVTLALEVNSGDMPLGSFIHYTLDGTDPGDSGSQPAGGMLYTGPFRLDGLMGSHARVIARVYPPAQYAKWFHPSPASDISYTLPAATEVYVGGNFYLPSGFGAAMRNVARLKGTGAVDTRFDTGSGASENSLVGVIRQTETSVYSGGDFESMNGIARAGVVRLNINGTVDTGFDAALEGASP